MNEKQIAAEKAVEFIEDGMIVGLGTGSTVTYLIKKLAQKVDEGLKIKAVSTSTSTSKLAESLGIHILNFDDVGEIDLTIDGADEVDKNLNGIKGGGGALLFEKIVATSSRKNIWIVDSTKLVDNLGKFPLPVEVVPFGIEHTISKLKEVGYNPELRLADEKIFLTDGNHYTIDLHLNKITEPIKLEHELKKLPGIVEIGLFINIADMIIVGRANSYEILRRE
jgi:ribose 5-phosphate isomerase A